jgi:hypothetical protein
MQNLADIIFGVESQQHPKCQHKQKVLTELSLGLYMGRAGPSSISSKSERTMRWYL